MIWSGLIGNYKQHFECGEKLTKSLEHFLERLPGSIQAAARAAQAMGLSVNGTTEELFKLMKDGKLVSEDFLPYFSEELMKAAKNGGALEESMKSTAASIGRFQTAVWNANRTFNQSGFDKAVGSLFDQTSNSIRKADPLWAALGRMAIGVGKALEVPIEFLGTLGKILGGAMMGADGTLNGEVIALGASFLALSKTGRKLGKNFLLPVAAMMAFTDYMENGITGADDLAFKLGILTAAIFAYGNKLKWLAGIAAAHPVLLVLLGITGSEAMGDGTIQAAADKLGISVEEYKKTRTYQPKEAEIVTPEEIAQREAKKAAARAAAEKAAAEREARREMRNEQQSTFWDRRANQEALRREAREQGVTIQELNMTNHIDGSKSPEATGEAISNAISRAASSNPITEK